MPEKQLPVTYWEYQLALMGFTENSYTEFMNRELTEGEHLNPDPGKSGWKVSVTVETRARSTKHWLHIENEKFGIKPCKMLVNRWQSITRGFRETWMSNPEIFNQERFGTGECLATREQVFEALALLLVSCKPKNLGDYPPSTLEPMLDLGFYFAVELWEKANEVVERSDWQDWSKYWRDRCLKAEDEVRALKGLPPVPKVSLPEA